MAHRPGLPPAWLVAAVLLAGLVTGVLLGRGRDRAAVAPPLPPSPLSLPQPQPEPQPSPFAIPGSPPLEIARALSDSIPAAFRPSPDADAAFARVREQVDRWAAASERHPLASAAWWRAALRSAHPPAGSDRTGLVPGAVPWRGRPFPVLFSVPAGAGPFPAVVALVDGDPREEIPARWGALLGTHLVAAVPRSGPVAADPRLALLTIAEAGRRFAVDRDRVVLDGTGGAAAAVAAIAPAEACRFAGVVLRGSAPPGEPAENLAQVPLLREPADDAAVARWVADLPPRRAADPRRPQSWATLPGDALRAWGPGFVLRRLRSDAPGALARVYVERDPLRNTLHVQAEGVAELLLLLTDEGLDLDRPLGLVVNGRTLDRRTVARSLDTLRTWALQEPGLLVTAELLVEVP